jgi:hypothetical protein
MKRKAEKREQRRGVRVVDPSGLSPTWALRESCRPFDIVRSTVGVASH